jgi:hypothetical protein
MTKDTNLKLNNMPFEEALERFASVIYFFEIIKTTPSISSFKGGSFIPLCIITSDSSKFFYTGGSGISSGTNF